jgi:tetratricopeptide (TPR) repeat protein
MELDRYRRISERAEHYSAVGNWTAAKSEWLRALPISPDGSEVMLEISYVESLAGNYRQAREWALRAADPGPRSREGAISLVRRLRTFNELRCLRRKAADYLDDRFAPAAVLVECASQLNILNDYEPALECAEAAVGRAPDDPSARLVRGQLLAQYARFDRAAQEFEWVLQRHPRSALAWWLLARIRKQTSVTNHVPQLRALIQTPGLPPGDRALVARALHKELDDLGDSDGAWHALEMLCDAKRRMERYDAAELGRLVEALIRWEPAAASIATSAEDETTPIFIVGMYRSGTTLLEQLLDASDDVRGLGELNDFCGAMRYSTDHYSKEILDQVMLDRASCIDMCALGQRYLESVACRLEGKRFFTDKLPANFLNIGFICHALPQARIVHMVRDPMETCFSNLREIFTGINTYSYDQAELAGYFLQYRRLMAHWHAAYPGRILDVDYAALTRDPEAVMRKVAVFCGIDYTDAMRDPRSSTRAVATASAVQVRDRVVRREVPKWAPYAKHLQPLIGALRQGGVEIPELPA